MAAFMGSLYYKLPLLNDRSILSFRGESNNIKRLLT